LQNRQGNEELLPNLNNLLWLMDVPVQSFFYLILWPFRDVFLPLQNHQDIEALKPDCFVIKLFRF
jgi:hypothetical protein